MSKYQSIIEDFEKALGRLEEVLAIKEATDIVRDSAIQRFEIVFDLGWKTAKAYLEEFHNTSCVSPRQCFKELHRRDVIEYDPFWVKVSSARNYTVHTYSEVLAKKIFAELPATLIHFKDLLRRMKESV